MNDSRKVRFDRLAMGVSLLAIGIACQPALAQDDVVAQNEDDAIVVTGIRASLEQAQNIKRNAQGVVDAISAEDIGKFPDTNLAESLQRITGVSIDRASGEGSTVTVRGFGPEFNLVVVNGRQMPTSTLGDGFSAPSTRSFDFGNLAAEGVAGVEVYKSGRASLPTGGIGSVINIKLPRPLDRPGLNGSIGVKGVYDTSQLYGTDVTPEISGIISKTFADDRIGILLAGSYQKRNGGQAQFTVGNWRPGYTGAENNWGTLAQPGDPRFANIENRPGPTDIYQVPQNAAYDFYDFQRERINGQAVLQFKPTDSLDVSLDYIFAQNTFDSRQSSIGVWFNHNDTSSSWTNGPAAGANFYAENFAAAEGKDLAITGAVGSNRNINHSFGGNIKWEGPWGLRLELDGHHSTAESKPTSPYGSGIAVGTAIFGVASQRVDFTTDMPVISVAMHPGSEIAAENIRPAGNAFRNAYMKDTIDQVSLRGGFDFDASFIESLDFGASYLENDVRTAFGVIQNDTWGGTLSAADTPDSLFTPRALSPDLSGMSGSRDPAIIPTYFLIDTAGLISLLDDRLGICDAAPGDTCLAPYSTDRRILEKSITPWVQSFHSFDLGDARANLRLGLRYEKTKVTSRALAEIPTGTVWVAQNEISLVKTPGTDFTTLKGEYDNWLPAIDFDLSPFENVKLRASYSHTITRPDYASMQGGITLAQPLRVGAGGSQASAGNPALLPYKSKNVDLSAEWYYDRASYVSVGFFNKKVSNFIANDTTQTPLFDLPDPSQGAAATAARQALGPNASFDQIVAWVQANRPADYVAGVGTAGGVAGRAGDPNVIFTFTQPSNSDQQARLWGWEFAIQHNFWDTGFGAILNYTVVNSDTGFDNTLPWTTTQFAVPGASDSANAVLYYDKNGLQARIAYNWRDRFLAGKDQDPYYIKSYGQFDASLSYEFKKGLTAFVEGINITNADRTGVRRNDRAIFFAAPGYARYSAGIRFTF
ncbi:TonB-dependent receptor [Sphingopyxis alaskensis]|jgi:TonB-dependent receptor|uniref:TonB-dependent receptor n=1 Tax=Sphingopyxis alaskensis (strain DSM 13593 / LMG 18877 / RB2256) TaxID=317655 RepID=Q1GUP0_SPHAL|nr:TonB-dependent receptor [Sphingopyxis alaskensis]ABF52632.1 TonB-dependent receptor [Sphingopyxis alaskensis RB2256]MCM3418165.1 TonB-dependent receptor [Sphingopyxis alaskensis]